MNRMTRTTALALSALGLTAITACGGGGSSSSGGDTTAPTSINLGLVQAQDFIHAMPARVATEQGFFKDEGLTVNVIDFSAGSDLTKAMAGGSVDVGAATGLDAVSASAHDIPLQAFNGVYAKSPMVLVVAPNSKISGFADLKGTKVGISKAGSLTDYVTRAALAKVNLPIDSVTEVPLGDPATTMAALGRGDIDAFVLPVTFGYVAAAQGQGKIAQTAAAVLGQDDQFAVLMANKDYIAKNAPALKKLTAAYSKALTWMAKNKDATIALAVSKLKLPAPIAQKTYEDLIGNFTPDGKLNAAGLAGYAKALPTLGIASTSPAESNYLSTAIVPGG